MIKANELRIGNLVEANLYKERKICVISSIVDVAVKLDLDNCRTDLELIDPIPLTEEWLVKFGFDFIEEVSLFADKYHCISETRKELDYWVFMPFCTDDEDCFINIKYVHSLQNLYFALTGTELEYNGKG